MEDAKEVPLNHTWNHLSSSIGGRLFFNRITPPFLFLDAALSASFLLIHYQQTSNKYPSDLMLTFDYALMLASLQRWQEATRMYHRCLALRDDVPGLWISLATALDELGETESADRARQKARALQQPTGR